MTGLSTPHDPALPAHLRRYAGAWTGKTIAGHARALAERAPSTVSFIGETQSATYASLLSDATALAVSLVELGIRPGEVISFQTPNWVEAAVINLAAALGGYAINPIVVIYRDAEVRQMLADCGSRVLFVAERFRNYDFAAMADRLRPDLPQLAHVVLLRAPARPGSLAYQDLVDAGTGRRLCASPAPCGSVKLVLYTSGTSGRPKAVLHSHDTLTSAVAGYQRVWTIAAGDAILVPSPVTHVSGYCNGLELPFLLGTRSILMESWDAGLAADLIERHEVVGTIAATPFLQELATVAAAGRPLPSLRFFACGGAAVAPEIIRGANAAFARPCAFRVFGSSEVPLVTMGFDPAIDPEQAATTDGRIVGYEVRLVDENGEDTPPGAAGEILVRGPAMMLGYADAEQTRQAITEDGYFRSGDIGCFTAGGGLLITGRKKDLIIRGGENISPKEIEDVLHRHPAVTEAAVVGMPHPRLGEGICAFVVAAAGIPVDAPTLIALVVTSGLARQKCPERIVFVQSLPKTASGKIRKDVLRATAAAG